MAKATPLPAVVEIAIERLRAEFGDEVRGQLKTMRTEMETDITQRLEHAKSNTAIALRELGGRLDGVVATTVSKVEENRVKLEQSVSEFKGNVEQHIAEHCTIMEGRKGDASDTGLKGKVATISDATRKLERQVSGEDGTGGIVATLATHSAYLKIAIAILALLGTPMAAAVVYLVLHALGAKVQTG